jgi:hypothetical protein
MVTAGERWPPVYDLDDLVAEIKRLTDDENLERNFFEWRLDRSTLRHNDICQKYRSFCTMASPQQSPTQRASGWLSATRATSIGRSRKRVGLNWYRSPALGAWRD